MTHDPQLEEAHRRVWDLLKELDDEGIPAAHAVDALMGIGLTIHAQLSGPKALAGVMRRAADAIEAGQKFTGDMN